MHCSCFILLAEEVFVVCSLLVPYNFTLFDLYSPTLKRSVGDTQGRKSVPTLFHSFVTQGRKSVPTLFHSRVTQGRKSIPPTLFLSSVGE